MWKKWKTHSVYGKEWAYRVPTDGIWVIESIVEVGRYVCLLEREERSLLGAYIHDLGIWYRIYG